MSDGQNQQGFPQITQPIADKNGIINQSWYQLLISLWTRTGGSIGSQTFLTGDMKLSASSAGQDGWLICDGAAVSRSGYRALFNTIGTAWGVGDGSTTFNVPNLTGKFPRGGATPGAHGGADSVTLSIANLAPHNHPVLDPGHHHNITDPKHHHNITDPTHAHSYDAPSADTTAMAGADPVGEGSAGSTTGAAATGITINDAFTGVTVNDAFTGVTTSNTGSATPFSILPSYATVIYLIKT